ncbi:MAG: hypothetical protein AAFR31_20910, partial [Cyanobacteria bacterium J06627_8]
MMLRLYAFVKSSTQDKGTAMGHKIEAAAITDHEIKSVLAVSSSIKKEINQNVLATKTPKKYITIL